MQLFIRPMSTQFHRDGLPFDAGQDAEVSGLFPPFPRTFYGSLRTRGKLAKWPNPKEAFTTEDDDIYGSINKLGSFSIRGPILAGRNPDGRISNQLFFPFPYDLVAGNESKKLFLLTPSPGLDLGNSGWDLMNFSVREFNMPVNEKLESLQGEYFFPYRHLGSYLLHSFSGASINDFQDFSSGRIFRKEERIGLARNISTRTNIESMLYRVSHFRMFDVPRDAYGFWIMVEAHHQSFPENGLLQLGGDFRPAEYFKLAEEDSPDWWSAFKNYVVEKIAQSGRFKAFFLTPAIFKEGSCPDVASKVNKNIFITISTSGLKIRFKIIGIYTGKPKFIGGWDIQSRFPKNTYKAVPEGSVYFFQIFEDDQERWNNLEKEEKSELAEVLFDHYNFKPWCSEEPWEKELGPGKEGFGIPLIGGW